MAPVKAAVPTPNDNYPGQQHEHMKGLVTQNYAPDTASATADVWREFGTTFKELATDFDILVNGSQSAWTGQAADGVRKALTKIGTFAGQTGDGFTRTSNAIEQQRDAAVQANRGMPEPVKFSPMDSLKKFAVPAVIFPPAMVGAPIEMMAQHSAQQEAKAEAVQVMQTRDSTMMAAAMSMPTMESTPQVTQDQGVTQASSSTSTASLSNNNGFRPPSSTGMPGIPSPNLGNNTTNPSWVAPGTTNPGIPPANPPGGRLRPPVGPPGTLPPGMLPPGMRPPGGGQNGRPGTGPGGPGAGRGGPGGGGAGGGRGMGPGGTGPGGMAGVGGSGRGMGSFGPATPGGSAGVAGGPGGAAGAAGAGAAGRGAAGAGGMGAGGGAGAGRGGEEDKEHKSNYLLPTDEFFDDDRMVAPPVIGG